MSIWIITGMVIAAGGVMTYIIAGSRKSEMQKYYDAAYKVIKEECLNQAIRNVTPVPDERQKIMIYLKWKDRSTWGYVFDPLPGVRIGRDPEKNEICIRDVTVSSNHCRLYLSGGRLAIQDFQSVNGTYIRRGIQKRQVQNAEYIFSGDKICVGSLKIKVTIFTFDMANI